jgi:hypothetical protein
MLLAGPARAEKTIFHDDTWELYTDGRVAGFLSWVYGDGFPQATYGVAPGGMVVTQVHDVKGGGWSAESEKQLLNDPTLPPNQTLTNQGTINMMRVRSGTGGNQVGLGVRYQITPALKASAYIQIWAWIESIGRMKNQPNFADVRVGYGKIEGGWGSFYAGRMRTLFSRGATDIDVMYAHRWGVGFPNVIDSNGPTLGQIGFGVLGSGWAAGLLYETPVLAGFQLQAGVFDPIQLQGNGSWFRTTWARPEGQLTFEQPFGTSGGTPGKVVLFVNGAIQDVYKDGYCPPQSATNPLPCKATAGGVGFGGRFEYGPVHIGVASHRGNGLGLNYALEVSDSSTDPQGNLRASDGYYGQSQVVLGQFDLFAGAGITRIFLTDADRQTVPDPRNPTGGGQVVPHSVIKYQFGINAGVVYNLTPNIHLDLDYFRAQAAWYLGENQVIHVANGGMTLNW